MIKQILLLLTVVSIVGCAKEETPQPTAIDFKAELKKSEWIYYSWDLRKNEIWTFVNDTMIQSKVDSTIVMHKYNVINDSFIFTPKHVGMSWFIVYANLKLINDTIYWRYHNMTDNRIFLIKHK